MDDLDIFSAALELSTPEEREKYLLSACGDNAALRERIEALLRSSEKVSRFMESPAVAIEGPPTVNQPITEKPGTQIGPYHHQNVFLSPGRFYLNVSALDVSPLTFLSLAAFSSPLPHPLS